MADTRQALTLAQAADLLSVHADTIVKYLDAGDLDGFRLPSGHRRVYADSVEAMRGES